MSYQRIDARRALAQDQAMNPNTAKDAAMKTKTSQHGKTASAARVVRVLPRVGDRYRKRGSMVEVTGVNETHVSWDITAESGTQNRSDTLEVFALLEKKSLEWGAVFEPAPNAALCDPAHGYAGKPKTL